MTRSEIQEKLIGLVNDLIVSLGNDPQDIGPESNPIKEFPGFDSLNGLVVTVQALDKFGIEEGKVTDYQNILVSSDGKNPISIKESVDRIEALIR